MSLLDTASLIVTPNAVKEGKLYSVIPSDGSGDLSVTRATTATRVNSAGLVELVPYNLLQYSEQFDNAFWFKARMSITANSTTAPNGTTTADSFVEDSNNNSHPLYTISANVVQGSVYTISVYLKKGSRNYFNITPIAGNSVFFDLNNGTTSGTGASIESVGNGWYRCILTYTASSTNPDIYFQPSPNGVDTYYQGNGSVSAYIWGAQLNEGILKDYQKTETRLNIPRLDYSNGTCPSLLVEPQRTNLVYPSQAFGSWNNYLGSSLSSNSTISPSGIQNASTLTFGSNLQSQLYSNVGDATNTTHTVSVWVKSSTGKKFRIKIANSTSGGDDFSSNFTTTSEWQRFTFTTTSGIQHIAICNESAGGTGSIDIWGAQLEAGSYPTSYIPTTSASVTRNADVISKTGISSLIGQTEGTLFVEAIVLAHQDNNTILSVNDGSLSEYMVISGNASGEVNAFILDSGNVSSVISGTYAVGTTLKCALAYKTNDVAYYINGVQIGVDTSVTIPTTSQVNIGSLNFLTAQLQGNIKAAALWKTRLTNTQLAQLTTI